MLPRPLTVLVVASLALAAPGVASAATTSSAAASTGPELGSPIVAASSMTAIPPGFTSDATQALTAAEHSPTMQALHRREHPLRYTPYVWQFARPYWYITFSYHGRIVAQVDVSPAGELQSVWTGPQAIAPYGHGHYAPEFDKWWVIAPSALLFLLPFFDPRRLRRMVHLDALVLLSFLVSYLLLNGTHLVPAVWLAYPPLLYLLARMLWLGFRGSHAENRLAPLLSNRMLIVGLLLIVAGRIVLALVSNQEIDVGAASVVGAHRILHGLPLYFPDPGHGDTYGPVAYLAYVPFELLWPMGGAWSGLAAADWAAITFDVLTIVGLFFVGRRLRPGLDGSRLGLVLAWGWAACPFTLLALMVHTNDALVAMLTVGALLVFASPVARGAMLALAAAAKFSPAALLPLFAQPRRGLRGAVTCVVTFTVVVVGAIAVYLPSGGLTEFYNRTIGYQINRPDVFSPWALHPSLHPVQTVIEVLAVALVAFVAFVPKERPLPRLCALAAAVTIAVQLPAVHWFYYYILWFMPFVLVALLVRAETGRPERPDPIAVDEPEPAAEPRVRVLAEV